MGHKASKNCLLRAAGHKNGRTSLSKTRKYLQSNTFVECRDRHGRTPLMLASSQGNFQTVKVLVEHANASLCAVDKAGWTAHMWAVKGNRIDVLRYLISKDMKLTRAKANDGVTIFLLAAEYGWIEILRYLAESCDVSLTEVTKNGNSALDLAVIGECTSVIEYLVECLHGSEYFRPFILKAVSHAIRERKIEALRTLTNAYFSIPQNMSTLSRDWSRPSRRNSAHHFPPTPRMDSPAPGMELLHLDYHHRNRISDRKTLQEELTEFLTHRISSLISDVSYMEQLSDDEDIDNQCLIVDAMHQDMQGSLRRGPGFACAA